MLVLVLPALALTILAFTAVCGWLIFSVDEPDIPPPDDGLEPEPSETLRPRRRRTRRPRPLGG